MGIYQLVLEASVSVSEMKKWYQAISTNKSTIIILIKTQLKKSV